MTTNLGRLREEHRRRILRLVRRHTGRASLDELVVEAGGTGWHPTFSGTGWPRREAAEFRDLAAAFDARAAEFGFAVRAWRGTAQRGCVSLRLCVVLAVAAGFVAGMGAL